MKPAAFVLMSVMAAAFYRVAIVLPLSAAWVVVTCAVGWFVWMLGYDVVVRPFIQRRRHKTFNPPPDIEYKECGATRMLIGGLMARCMYSSGHSGEHEGTTTHVYWKDDEQC